MPRDPFDLAAGEQLAPADFVVSAAEAHAYRAAVGDASPVYDVDDAPLPPLLLAAHGLRRLMEQVDIRPGSVHGAQECEFLAAAYAGQPLRMEASVARAATRQGQRILVLEFAVLAAGEANAPLGLCRGRATLLVPGTSPPLGLR